MNCERKRRRLSDAFVSQSRRGAALVIVLAFVVLLTVFAVTFFSRATTDRQISHSSSNQTKADLLARGALAVTLGDLEQEIAAGSIISTVSGPIIYTPKVAAGPLPGTLNCSLSGSTGTGGLENLIKRSANGAPFYPAVGSYDSATYPASNRAAGPSALAATNVLSQNQRSVSLARWNKPLLLQKATPASDTDITPVNFTAPDWILVARDGSNPTTWNVNMVTSKNNAASILGRYAYTIYDEGGLLDMNIAGNPTVSTPAQIGRKGPVAYADLLQIPGIAAVAGITPLTAAKQSKLINDIVGWRNFASASATGSLGSFSNSNAYTFASSTSFYNMILTNTNGFLKVANTALSGGQSDRMFAGRQQLINLLVRGIASNTGAAAITERANLQWALQYLGTFSRELNRATWKPFTPATSTIDYAILANTPTPETSVAINRDLTAVRLPVGSPGFIRPDGTQAVAGDPLLKNRFSLARLGGVGPAGPNTTQNTTLVNGVLVPATAATIQRDFGLVWNSVATHWDYVGYSGSTVQTTIKKLDQITAENREPNFFELLKAVILSGSVGLGSGSASTFLAAEPKYYDTTGGLSADYQIMQIGANIIDSWESDNVPTFINLGGNELAGVENLPYLNKLVFCARIPKSTGAQGPIDSWLVPSLWNPHQNGSAATSTGNRVRIALTGSPSYTAGFTVGLDPPYATNPIVTIPTPSMDVAANGFMAATPPSDPAPAPLPPGPVGAVSSVADSTGPEKYYGFHFVFSTPPTSAQVNQSNTDNCYPDFAGSGSVELRVQLPDTTYKTYQKWNILPNPTHPLTAQGVRNNGDFSQTNKMVDPEYVALDPRTLRFGVWGTDANSQGGNVKKQASYGAEDSLDLGAPANRIEQITWSKPQGSAFTVTPNPTTSTPSDLSLYATNGASGTTNHYVDLDGVERRGDWTTDPNGTTSKLTIMYASDKSAPAGNYFDRPNLLSATFQSVAELGQVFRDQPWKTLAFTIANSGDAGLLDAFTLQDVPIIAGRTSLNTKQSPVLTAILSQATRALLPGTKTINPADVPTIADRLKTLNAANPMISKSELVTTLMGDANLTAIWNTTSTTNPWNKEGRECVVRAFSDACQTRTWNLMIDVIAQSGRYPASATNVSQFVVEGEKRYWLHVAIDRFTGEVIDQQLEAVYE